MMYYTEDRKVIEKATGRVIEICRNIAKAKQICGKLNAGSGFNGWTPDFFLTKKRGVKTKS